MFRAEAEKLAAFQADLQAIRREPDTDRREALVRRELQRLEGSPALSLPQVAVEMVLQIRDTLKDWPGVVAFIDRLDDKTRLLPFFEEQRLLALAKTGDDARAVAHLEAWVALRGETPERMGLIGGRYKRLWRSARDARLAAGEAAPASDERSFLGKAIAAYDTGMQLDLNAYYCACNLPQLLLARGRKPDVAKARMVDFIVVAACERGNGP